MRREMIAMDELSVSELVDGSSAFSWASPRGARMSALILSRKAGATCCSSTWWCVHFRSLTRFSSNGPAKRACLMPFACCIDCS